MATTVSEKPFSQAIAERRATQSFDGTPVPLEHLKQILQAGLEAPSGYNLQPWRFVVVRDPEQRKRLRAAAMNQPKVEEAPVVIVACADPQGWKNGDLEEMLKLAEHLNDETRNLIRKNVSNFLGGQPGDAAGIAPDFGVWANRHAMIALTTMMWMAEVLGYDTAPMEGFSEKAVKQTLGIPERVRVVALLAVGRRQGPKKPYGKRFPMERVIFAECWGQGLK